VLRKAVGMDDTGVRGMKRHPQLEIRWESSNS